MLKLLDRQMCVSYMKSYLVCLVSLLGLFIVVDLFNNLDEFTKAHLDFVSLVRYIATYYGFCTAKIFDRLSEVIVLLAAMFTVAWMQRSNELVPLLSAGVSTRRVVGPVLACAFVMLGLSAINQELILPKIDGFFLENRGNPEGNQAIPVSGAYEPNGIHISGNVAIRKDLLVKDVAVVFPAKLGGDQLALLQAREARYIAPSDQAPTGGWKLYSTTPLELEHWSHPEVLEMIVPGQFFLHTVSADFDRVTRGKDWTFYISTLRLIDEIQHSYGNELSSLAVLLHRRLTRPILGMVLVLLGLSVILRDQNRNVFVSAGLCLILCGVFFVACFTCQNLGNTEKLSPALAAWLPVIFFGPLSLVMFDAVHT